LTVWFSNAWSLSPHGDIELDDEFTVALEATVLLLEIIDAFVSWAKAGMVE
jgi:hypothetical protein